MLTIEKQGEPVKKNESVCGRQIGFLMFNLGRSLNYSKIPP